MHLTRRLRGVVGTMGVWAVAFSAFGVATTIPLWLLGVLPQRIGWLMITVPVRWALGGAVIGLGFATAVLIAERRRTLSGLSSRRFAAWGFLAGAIVPLSLAAFYTFKSSGSFATQMRGGLFTAAICGVTGAALAVASLRAARRSPVTGPG